MDDEEAHLHHRPRDDEGLHEQQPFLPPSAARPHSQQPSWKLAALFFLLVILSVSLLSAVPLGLQLISETPTTSTTSTTTTPGGQGQDQNHQSSHNDEQEHHDHDPEPAADQAAKPAVLFYDDELPSVPRLRDVSQYVLDPLWDLYAPPTTREFHWTILDARLNPDGVYRHMILINNQFPGPLVECNEGDTIVVHVENKAVNATSIHFHGFFQNGTNSMDGAVGITQCPIAPNSAFTYTFQVQGQSGTYWYHAHHSAQASDGLLGPVVVHSKDERTTLQQLEYASDRILMVQDHYHNLTSEILMDYLQPDMENDEPVPDNALINGRGVRDCRDFAGWDCDAADASAPVLDLAAGQRHRLRIINVGAFAEFQIQFDEHPFYVTEVDGTDVHPEPFHRLNILPAQRYSVVIETNATTADAFWMRARMVTHCFRTKNSRLEPEIRAVVRYTSPGSEASGQEPASHDWPDAIEVACRDLNTSALRPVVQVSPPPADDFVLLHANFMIGAWRLARGFFNESTWRHNATSPSLHRFIDAPPRARALDAPPVAVNDVVYEREREFVLQTEGIRTVDIAINNFDDGAHPFHLHGHKFFVLVQDHSGYPPSAADLPAYLERHGGGPPANPLRRDTVTVQGYKWAIVRVVLDNPGMWALHCHNMWHAESGMVMQLLVRSDVVRGWEVDPRERSMCQLEGVETGMRPDDSIWFGHF